MVTADSLLETPRWRSLISWGAIIAGLFFVITASWLLFLLGSAIGVSIADASDMEAIGKGFGLGAAIWIVLSGIISFFLGSWVAARLSGRPDDNDGVLHGLTLWSVATVVMLVLGSWGIGSVIHAGQGLISGTASVGKMVAQSGGIPTDLSQSPLVTDVEAAVKRVAADALARSADQANPDATAGAEQPETSEEVRQALNQINGRTLERVAGQLIAGNPDGAKAVLAANTTLTEQQINTLIDGAQQQVSQRVEEAKQKAKQAAEQVSTYTQAVMWAFFFSALLALVASLIGGMLGARTLRRRQAYLRPVSG